METITTNHCTLPGGIMTEEVGAISGEVSIKTVYSQEQPLETLIAYAESNEWYQITGGPISPGQQETGLAAEAASHQLLHAYVVVQLLTDRGVDSDGNPIVNDLNATWP